MIPLGKGAPFFPEIIILGWFHVKLWKCISSDTCMHMSYMYMLLFLSLHIWISAGQLSIIIEQWCKWLVWMAEAYVQLRIQYNYRTLSGYLDEVDFAEPGFRQKPSEIRESQWDRRVEGQRKKERKKEKHNGTSICNPYQSTSSEPSDISDSVCCNHSTTCITSIEHCRLRFTSATPATIREIGKGLWHEFSWKYSYFHSQ